MRYSGSPLAQFLHDLAARQATPGGGSASAVGGALGAALGSMAANFTIGNEKYQSFDASARAASAALESLRFKFLALAEEDMAAYESYRAAVALPKTTADDKSARSKALADARERSTVVPERILGAAREALEQIDALSGAVNPNLAGDVASAAYFLEASGRGAAIQIFSNCAAADTTGENVRRRIEAERAVERCEDLRNKIQAAVLSMLNLGPSDC